MDKIEKFLRRDQDERALYYNCLASQAGMITTAVVSAIFVFYYGYKFHTNPSDTQFLHFQPTVLWISMSGILAKTVMQVKWKAAYKKDVAGKDKK